MGAIEPIYHIDRIIKETGKPFNDEAHIIYVNGAYRDESPLGLLMHDFACINPEDMHYKILADKTRYFKENEKGRKRSGVTFVMRRPERSGDGCYV